MIFKVTMNQRPGLDHELIFALHSDIDNIYSSVSNVVTDTGGAAVELRTAEAYQRRAGKRMFCLFLVFLAVLSIVLLAVGWSRKLYRYILT